MWNVPHDHPKAAGYVEAIALAMKPRDWKELSCVSFCADRASLALALRERYAGLDGVYVFGDDAGAVAVAGFLELRPGTISLLFFSTDRLDDIWVELTRFVRKHLFPEMIAAGIHRIEADTMDGEPRSAKWLEILGLSREARMPHYGKGGEAFLRYAWTRDDRPYRA